MVVPNYIPDPIEVPNNVSDQKYALRVAFIGRVSILHALSILIVAGVAVLDLPRPNLTIDAILLGACLLVLSLVRIETRGTKADVIMSGALLPVLMLALAFTAKELQLRDIPAWAPLIGLATALTYTLLSGKDFSFIGQWFLAFIASNVAIAAIALTYHKDPTQAAKAIALNSVTLTYYVYDLASLLARRRIGEELGAVVDLYRDVLNFGGYFVRCLRH